MIIWHRHNSYTYKSAIISLLWISRTFKQAQNDMASEYCNNSYRMQIYTNKNYRQKRWKRVECWDMLFGMSFGRVISGCRTANWRQLRNETLVLLYSQRTKLLFLLKFHWNTIIIHCILIVISAISLFLSIFHFGKLKCEIFKVNCERS